MAYKDIYKASLADPEAFWMNAAAAIDWDRPPTRALSAENAPLYQWFADGMLNGCWNAVDRHVEAGHGDRTAIIYDSPVTDTKRQITFTELKAQTARLGGALAARRFQAQGNYRGVLRDRSGPVRRVLTFARRRLRFSNPRARIQHNLAARRRPRGNDREPRCRFCPSRHRR